LKELFSEYLRNGTGELTLFENDEAVVLRHCSGTLLLSVQLARHSRNESMLVSWMRLGAVSLAHFQGALALSPDSGDLWLIHCVPNPHDEQHLLHCIESLLNQRDTWRATVARLNKPIHQIKPTWLRSLLH
jgi:hypothetical protein